MKAADFRSESGLRPASAFLVIACVLVCVSVNAVRISMQDVDPPSRSQVERSPEPDFDIIDRNGQPLAFSLRRADLVVSPRSAWRAHTPDYMAGLIANKLDGACTQQELLGEFLPHLQQGVYVIPADKLVLSRVEAERVCEMLDRGVFAEPEDPRPLEGVYLIPTGSNDEYQLAWEPEYVLSKVCRDEQAGEEIEDISPIAWTNNLLFELTTAIRGKEVEGKTPTERSRARMKSADLFWDLMMPSGHEVALEDVPLDCAHELIKMLEKQGMKSHQMVLSSRVVRAWPQREGRAGEAALEILGRWGHVSPARAEQLVEEDLGYVRPVASVSEVLAAPARSFDRAHRESLDTLHPVSGLERSIDRMLRGETWDFLERGCAEYRFKEYYCARPRMARRYYVDACQSSTPPRVTTTLDLDLQGYLRQRLEGVMEEHSPALAMAIVVDVQSAEVLAVDGVSELGVRAFLPTWHLFTPGSTFKVIVMATALEAGVVTPDKLFNAHNGEWYIPGYTRKISEAEGEKKDWATAAEAIAYSLNIVLTQIGLEIEDTVFRAKLVELGYVEPPRMNLGTERAGYIPKLPWTTQYTHASMSFGHELQTSLWSHATALSCVLRGGDLKPLRLLSEVEQNGVVYEVPSKPETPDVFSPETCIQVREMMYMGARVGTGRDLFDERLVLGTKTGTTEKVSTELCLHVELQHNQELQDELKRDGHVCDKKCRQQLGARPKPHGKCYTSSICAFGKLPGTERELMVLMVVDEPVSKEKYGSKVAGPAAKDVLLEALGLTRGGLPLQDWAASEVVYSDESLNLEEHPWVEVIR